MAGGRSESCVRAAITIKTLLTMDGFQLCQLLKLSLWILCPLILEFQEKYILNDLSHFEGHIESNCSFV